MIDYDKLKIAHELAAKTKQRLETVIRTFEDGDCRLLLNCSADKQCRNDLDFTIKKLQELTKPTPKFKVGEKVWMADLNADHIEDVLEPRIIDSISIKIGEYDRGWYYRSGNRVYLESCIYPTRADMIQVYIDYWSSLQNEETSTHSADMSIASVKEKCIHEKYGYKIEQYTEYYICKHCRQWIKKTGEDLIAYKKWIDTALNDE